MRTAVSPVIVSTLIAIAGTAFAGPYEDSLLARDRGDYEAALELLRPLADQGSAQAQEALGSMYYEGLGVKRDTAAALKWYGKAAEQGDPQAQTGLGMMYAAGDGVPKDPVEAVRWFRRAADHDFSAAQTDLGLMYETGQGVPRDTSEAMVWYRKAADKGYAAAQCAIATMYGTGNGVPKDDAQAATWYRKAAVQGFWVAQVNLGILYANGRGVSKDSTEAVKWYRRAADQGSAAGQRYLGTMYAKGEGVPRDDVQAYMWWLLAAARGDAAAGQNLEIIARNLGPGQLASARDAASKWRPEKPQPVNEPSYSSAEPPPASLTFAGPVTEADSSGATAVRFKYTLAIHSIIPTKIRLINAQDGRVLLEDDSPRLRPSALKHPSNPSIPVYEWEGFSESEAISGSAPKWLHDGRDTHLEIEVRVFQADKPEFVIKQSATYSEAAKKVILRAAEFNKDRR